MAADLIQFVDSIDASPTVRLDLNDNSPWRCPKFVHSPAQLRRAEGQNAMTNGGFVSSSAYGWGRVAMTLDLSGTQDAQAAQIQLLARELDRSDNYLKYQPNGLTKPVFFIVKRSNMTDVEDREAQTPKRRINVELLCEPFALGLRESLGPFTVNNDPAAGSNGLYFDLTGVIGDVAAPVLVTDGTRLATTAALAVRQHGTPSDLVFFKQAESCSLGVDTANPGGGPDAAMSGTGTNNYVQTSFATTPTMALRLQWDVISAGTSDAARLATAGTYRVLVCVRRSGAVAVIKARCAGGSGSQVGKDVTIPATTDRQLVDLGAFSIEPAPAPGGYASRATLAAAHFDISASRASTAETLDWDFVLLLPADESYLTWSASATSNTGVIDGVNESVYNAEDGSTLLSGGGKVTPSNIPSVSGGFPLLIPGRTNRVFYVWSVASAPGLHTKSDTASVTAYYHPCYLNIRPSAT